MEWSINTILLRIRVFRIIFSARAGWKGRIVRVMVHDFLDRSRCKTPPARSVFPFLVLFFFFFLNPNTGSSPPSFSFTYRMDGGLEQKKKNRLMVLGLSAIWLKISRLFFFLSLGEVGNRNLGNNCRNYILYSLSLIQGGGGGKEEKEEEKKLYKNKRHTGEDLQIKRD